MITMGRSANGTAVKENFGNVGLMEGQVPKNYADFAGLENAAKTESFSEAKERMSRNLDKLLNYDKESAQAAYISQETLETEEIVQKSGGSKVADDDITPTSTTMQFGDGEMESFYAEMKSEETKNTYKLNSKGKLMLVFYALAVAVILALIVLNTGVLSLLSRENMAKSAQVAALQQTYSELKQEFDQISSDETVIRVAENEYNMIKKA